MDHRDAGDEIQRLQITERCKRRAEDEDLPLRQIFDDVCRASGDAGHHVSFADLENCMYKRRRRAQPTLPTSSTEADAAVRASRYVQLNDSVFYRGVADAGENGSALLFASNEQLELLQSATEVYFDATFKVVPTIYYQLFTVFVPFADAAFPVVFAIMSRKTQALYTKVFDKIRNLVPQFAPTCAMADFEEASVSAFQEVFGNVTVSGCWFHYAQALMKRVNKEGLKEAYTRDEDVGSVVHCLMSLPLLPPRAIPDALSDIQAQVSADNPNASRLQKLIAYVHRQWITKRSIGPARLSVRDNRSRTNNVLESFHAALRRRIKVSHPNLYAFLNHLQNTTADQMSDVARLRNGLNIRRPKTKANIMNETRVKSCLAKFDNGSYSPLQFLRAVGHSMGAHTAALQPADSDSDDDDDDGVDSQSTAATPSTASTAPHTAAAAADAGEDTTCDVCFVAPREGFALVPCGHARFCESCAHRVAAMDTCPVCRSNITMVMRIFV